MSIKRLFLIVAIFLGASAAWVTLGQTTADRTSASEKRLGDDVERMFGPELNQLAPNFDTSQGPLPPRSSRIEVQFAHENRNKGLIWFSVYTVDFDAEYEFQRPVDAPGSLSFRMSLPENANIDALSVRVGERDFAVDTTHVDVPLDVAPGETALVKVHYVTRGQDSWAYVPQTKAGGLRNFRLRAVTNFEAIDYPVTGMSPTTRAGPRTDGKPGREAVWDYSQMLPAQNHTIGIVMPSRPSAGYLSARLSLFAPVSLFFFFLVLVLIQSIRGWKLHPVNYVFLAAAFFAFHILLAYLVDHVSVHAAFWVAALVSVFLVVSYLRLVLRDRSAILTAGVAQLVYLVFFSYAFFWEGWTGLTVVIGAVVTLFVIMQLTGRIDWDALGRRGGMTLPREADPSAPLEPA